MGSVSITGRYFSLSMAFPDSLYVLDLFGLVLHDNFCFLNFIVIWDMAQSDDIRDFMFLLCYNMYLDVDV